MSNLPYDLDNFTLNLRHFCPKKSFISILCFKKPFKIIEYLQQNFWTWVCETFHYNLLSLNFCLSSQSICIFVFVYLWITGSGCLPFFIYRVMLPPPLFSLNFCLSLQSFFSFSACLSPPRNLVITDFRNIRGYLFKNHRAGTWPALEGNKRESRGCLLVFLTNIHIPSRFFHYLQYKSCWWAGALIYFQTFCIGHQVPLCIGGNGSVLAGSPWMLFIRSHINQHLTLKH